MALSLSFDDARTSQIDTGLPLLNRLGVKVTFYVTSSNLSRRLEGWKQAAAAGHEIGSHSQTHPCTGNFTFSRNNALEDYTLARMEQELDNASIEIERLAGVRPVTFAYPCGQKFVGRSVEVKSYVPLVARRFIAGRGYMDEAGNDPLYFDPAQAAGVGFDDMDFEQMKRLVESAAAEGRWLIFAGHDIGRRGFQSVDTAALETLCGYAKEPSNGIWLDTVAAIARYAAAQRASGKAQ